MPERGSLSRSNVRPSHRPTNRRCVHPAGGSSVVRSSTIRLCVHKPRPERGSLSRSNVRPSHRPTNRRRVHPARGSSVVRSSTIRLCVHKPRPEARRSEPQQRPTLAPTNEQAPRLPSRRFLYCPQFHDSLLRLHREIAYPRKRRRLSSFDGDSRPAANAGVAAAQSKSVGRAGGEEESAEIDHTCYSMGYSFCTWKRRAPILVVNSEANVETRTSKAPSAH
jgi:hypothetical protein